MPRHILIAVAAGAALCGPAGAQGLGDPTRPPAALEGAPATAAAAPSGLQTIIRRQGAAPAAVINGQFVELGGQVGDSTLVQVGDDSVTLKSESGREVLWLTPGIEKKPVVQTARKTGDKARKP